MYDLHRRLVAGVAITATHASDILTVNREVFIHVGMNEFHRRLVAGVSVTATHASPILTINRDKKREILTAVISKDKKRGSLHLVPLIYCTKVDENSDFDIIKNKARRIEAKDQTQLRDGKDAITDNEEFSLP